jgi:hypothetical protein
MPQIISLNPPLVQLHYRPIENGVLSGNNKRNTTFPLHLQLIQISGLSYWRSHLLICDLVSLPLKVKLSIYYHTVKVLLYISHITDMFCVLLFFCIYLYCCTYATCCTFQLLFMIKLRMSC